MSSSGHQSFSINCSKSIVVAVFETSSIGEQQVFIKETVRIRGVDCQVLDISPCQIKSMDIIMDKIILFQSVYDSYVGTGCGCHLASRARAMVPDACGTAKLYSKCKLTSAATTCFSG